MFSLSCVVQDLLSNPQGVVGAHVIIPPNFCRLQGPKDTRRFTDAQQSGVLGTSIEGATLCSAVLDEGCKLLGSDAAERAFVERAVNPPLYCFATGPTGLSVQSLMGVQAGAGRAETYKSVAWAAHRGEAAPEADAEDDDAIAPFDPDDPADVEEAEEQEAVEPGSAATAARLEHGDQEVARYIGVLNEARRLSLFFSFAC